MKTKNYLLMPLWAPMQSWGDQVIAGDDRPSLGFPTHSGLCGLIAAALGVDRSDHTRLNLLHQTVNFIVLDFCKGAIQTDFYTVKGVVVAEGLKIHEDDVRPLGRKTYLADYVFLVAVYLENDIDFSLEEIGKAILRPTFSIYAGRRSYPFLLPPIFHVDGQIQFYEWENPFNEMIQLRNRENKTQRLLRQKDQKKLINLSESLFKNQLLPQFAEENQACFYSEYSEFSEVSIPYQIRDRYIAGPLKTRFFEERTVYSFSIQSYKNHYVVPE